MPRFPGGARPRVLAAGPPLPGRPQRDRLLRLLRPLPQHHGGPGLDRLRWHYRGMLPAGQERDQFDHYQVRSWRRGIAHITLSMPAHAWLAAAGPAAGEFGTSDRHDRLHLLPGTPPLADQPRPPLPPRPRSRLAWVGSAAADASTRPAQLHYRRRAPAMALLQYQGPKVAFCAEAEFVPGTTSARWRVIHSRGTAVRPVVAGIRPARPCEPGHRPPGRLGFPRPYRAQVVAVVGLIVHFDDRGTPAIQTCSTRPCSSLAARTSICSSSWSPSWPLSRSGQRRHRHLADLRDHPGRQLVSVTARPALLAPQTLLLRRFLHRHQDR